MLKKDNFLSPWDMVNVVEKITDSTGNRKILMSQNVELVFGYNTFSHLI